MNKLAIGIVGAVALAMAFSGSSLGDASVALDDSIGDFADSEPGRHECGNELLPDTGVSLTSEALEIGVSCTTGEHTRTGFSLGHGFSGFDYSTWDITIESWLRHDGDDRGFRCSFSGGAVSCAGLGGTFPGIGATFTHECIAYGAGTDPSILPWACHVTY